MSVSAPGDLRIAAQYRLDLCDWYPCLSHFFRFPGPQSKPDARSATLYSGQRPLPISFWCKLEASDRTGMFAATVL